MTLTWIRTFNAKKIMIIYLRKPPIFKKARLAQFDTIQHISRERNIINLFNSGKYPQFKLYAITKKSLSQNVIGRDEIITFITEIYWHNFL